MHALGQRQFRGVVDRVGDPTLVGLPRVRSGLPAAAGLLLPPNEPPIWPPEVPMLKLAMPQSDPSAVMNRSASRMSRVKIDDKSHCGRHHLAEDATYTANLTNPAEHRPDRRVSESEFRTPATDVKSVSRATCGAGCCRWPRARLAASDTGRMER
jgi:hypothetical protein